MIKSPPYILTISSAKTELHAVESFVNAIFQKHDLCKSCFNKVYLCISEAVTNSIVHGNKFDCKKMIEVRVDYDTHNVSVKITDEGDGFDFQTVPDPTKKENIKKESGRGIHIIKSLSKSVSFNNKGNSVQFEIECK